MKRILISGYYGFDNAGDEAVLAGLLLGLQSAGASDCVKISALSINPKSTTALHKIPAYHRYKELLQSILSTDLLLSGGGSLLQDVTSAHGIFYYLAVVRIAQILGRKTMFIAQGIGPLTRTRSQRLTKSVANRLNAITVRDTASSALLSSIGVTVPAIVTADPALLLHPKTTVSRQGVLLSMRDWPALSSSFAQDLAEAVKYSGINGVPAPLNMHGEADAAAYAKVLRFFSASNAETTVNTSELDYQSLLNNVGGSEMVIGMRLHSLIFAAAAGVPAFALSYDPKVAAFMTSTGQSDSLVDLKTVNSEELSHLLRKAWASRTEKSETLMSLQPRLRELAQKNADIAFDLL